MNYLTYDKFLGWKPRPNYWATITSKAKGFKFTVDISSQSFRLDMRQQYNEPEKAKIIILGDSNAFGFALDETETLSSKIRQNLSPLKEDVSVLNAGVPGYDISQQYLRLKTLKLQSGTIVISLIHPVNDAVNTANIIDYAAWKPYYEHYHNRFIMPKAYDPQCNYYFGKEFDKMNSLFQLPPPAQYTMCQRMADISAFFYLIQYRKNLSPYTRPASPHEIVWDDYADADVYGQQYYENIKNNPNQFLVRIWTEIEELQEYRDINMQKIKKLFAEMNSYIVSHHSELCVILAPEPTRNQKFLKNATDIVQTLYSQYHFSWGVTAKSIKHQLDSLSINTIIPDYSGYNIEEMFIPYDGHTSPKAFEIIAQLIVQKYFKSSVPVIRE